MLSGPPHHACEEEVLWGALFTLGLVLPFLSQMLQSLSAEGLVEERKRLQEKYQVEGVPDDMEFIEESAEKMAPAANAPQVCAMLLLDCF